MRFVKKIQDSILKSERIRKRILRFFTKQINPRSLGSWCFKGTEDSTLEMDSSFLLTHHDPRDLGLICLIEKHKIRFRILSDLRIQSRIFLKKRTLNLLRKAYFVRWFFESSSLPTGTVDSLFSTEIVAH